MTEQYKVKFEEDMYKGDYDKYERPRLRVKAYHNYETDPEIPDWNEDGYIIAMITDDKKQAFITGEQRYGYETCFIVFSKKELREYIRRLRKMVNEMVE